MIRPCFGAGKKIFGVHCASIVRTGVGTVAAPYVYTATGTLIPKGGCNEATIVGTVSTSVDSVKTNADTQFDALIAIAAPATCAANLLATFTPSKTANTATAIANRATANQATAGGSNEGCTSSIVIGTGSIGSQTPHKKLSRLQTPGRPRKKPRQTANPTQEHPRRPEKRTRRL